MTKKLSELLHEIPAEERQESAIEAARLAIGLKDLQAVAGILQTELARSLGVSQSAVSRRLGRDDMLVSTLREIIEAMGARLKLVVEVDGQEVPIKLGEQGGDRAAS